MQTFNLSQTINALGRVVEEAGYDHRATSKGGDGCRYVDFDGFFIKSICIVGRLLDRLGILRATVVNYDGGEQESACLPDSVLWANVEAMGVSFDAESRTFLREVQSNQDAGESWGLALSNAVTKHYDLIARDANRQRDFVLGGLPQPTVLDEGSDVLADWERELLNG